MATQLMPFQFENFPIRVVMQDGTPWWIAADVCAALEIGNTSMALARLDDDERTLCSTEGASNGLPVNAINEPGLYSLILGSRKPEAKAFKRWVTHDVLPAIRQTGSYSVTSRPVSVIDTLREWKQVAEYYGMFGNQAILSAEQAVIPRLGFSPMREIGITHLAANDRGMTYSPTELGQLMNPPLSAQKVNRLLEANGLQTQELGSWIPTDKAAGLMEWLDTAKRRSSGTPVKQLKWFKEVLDRLHTPALLQAA